jgi:hypothetical protein
MKCIHGFEVIQCPTCRIDNLSVPPIYSRLMRDSQNDLRAENPHFKKHIALKDEFMNDLMNRNKFKTPIFLRLLNKPRPPKMRFNFRKNSFNKELDKYSLNRLDKFNLLKKIELKKPDLDLDFED